LFFPAGGSSRQGVPPVRRRPIDITRTARNKTLRLGKGFVKDVKCLIVLDLSVFLAC
jgi:hypothetical protein